MKSFSSWLHVIRINFFTRISVAAGYEKEQTDRQMITKGNKIGQHLCSLKY